MRLQRVTRICGKKFSQGWDTPQLFATLLVRDFFAFHVKQYRSGSDGACRCDVDREVVKTANQVELIL